MWIVNECASGEAAMGTRLEFASASEESWLPPPSHLLPPVLTVGGIVDVKSGNQGHLHAWWQNLTTNYLFACNVSEII